MLLFHIFIIGKWMTSLGGKVTRRASHRERKICQAAQANVSVIIKIAPGVTRALFFGRLVGGQRLRHQLHPKV